MHNLGIMLFRWAYLVAVVLILSKATSGIFLNFTSISMRNARWLRESRLNWYHSYAPDLAKILTAGATAEGDDQKPGYDPGDVPTVQQINLKLRALCLKANATLAALNLNRQCASDLGFVVCRATDLTNSFVELATKYCQKQGSISNIRSCQEHVNKQREANMWTSKFLDSFGKVSGGLLNGEYMHFGSYQQCTQLRVRTPETEFSGKYCQASFSAPLSPTRINFAVACDGRNPSQPCEPTSSSYVLKWGFCAPSSCSTPEANRLVQTIIGTTGFTICPEQPLVECIETPPLASDPLAISMIVVCTILVLIIIASTIYDLIDHRLLTREWLGCSRQKTDEKEYEHAKDADATATINIAQTENTLNFTKQHHSNCIRRDSTIVSSKLPILGWYTTIFLAFSIYTNVKLLLKTKEHGRLRCVDGIRVLSFGWVVLAQTHLLLVDYVGNLVTYLNLPGILSFQIVNNGSFSTDTFFVVAGLLHAYVWLKQIPNDDEPRTKVNVAIRSGRRIIKRLFRILPVYIFILGVSIAFWDHVGEGPMWTIARYHHAGPYFCRQTWWTNLLFINNFVGLETPCMPWSWHVAVDMQIFLLAIPILLLYKRRPLAGFLVSVVLIILSIILNGIIVASYNLSPSLLASTDLKRLEAANEYYEKLYIKPYMRWNAYLIGIFAGYLLRRTEKNPNGLGLKILRLGPVTLAAWVAIVAVCSCIVYGLHGYASGHELRAAAVVSYAALTRTAWSLVIGLLIVLCLRTRKGLVDWFLSLPVWPPLGRLTYCAFLLHSLVLVFFYGTAKDWHQYTFGNVVYYWLSSLLVSYGLGLIAYVCVEAPGIRIGRAFFDHKESAPTVATPQSMRLLEQDVQSDAKISAR